MVNKDSKQKGFAAVELLLVALVLVLVGGISYRLMTKNKQSNRNQANKSADAKLELDAKLEGTSQGMETLSQYDVDEELKAEEDFSAGEQNDALGDAPAVSSTGEGYDVVY